MKARRNRKAQSLVEVLVGSFLLIPIALFGLDLSVLVLANTANDNLVKSAARAAANQASKPEAIAAARQCVSEFKTSPIIVEVKLADELKFEKQDSVVVKTIMTVKVPVGVAGLDILKFEAQAVEPVVALPADV